MLWKCLTLCYIVLFCFTWTTLAGGIAGNELYQESQVIKDILINNKFYVREARPATQANQTVNVTLIPVFVRIEEIEPRTNVITATIILIQSWTDMRLAWNKTQYEGVDRVRLPAEKIWLPDIVPYNTGASGGTDPVYEETVIVSSEGRVDWGPMMTISAFCDVDVTNFPYDAHSCSFSFGSWMHTVKEINIVFVGKYKDEEDIPVSMDHSPLSQVKHPQWEVVDGKIFVKLFAITFGPEKFGVISVTVNAKRRDSFYKYLAIGPGALLGFLVPVMFLLPVRSKEKSTFGMLLALGLILLIVVLSEAIPLNHSTTPRVGIFYLITLVLVSFSIILSILVSNISHKGARRRALPDWVHKACLSRNGLRRLMCIDQYAPVDNLFRETMRELEDQSESSAQDQPEVPGATEMASMGKLESQMRDMNKYLRYICGKLSAEDSYKNVNSDWEELARIMDRVLFVIFTILYALTAIGLLT